AGFGKAPSRGPPVQVFFLGFASVKFPEGGAGAGPAPPAVPCHAVTQDRRVPRRIVAALSRVEDEAAVLTIDLVAGAHRGSAHEVELGGSDRPAQIPLHNNLGIQLVGDESCPVESRRSDEVPAVVVRGSL